MVVAPGHHRHGKGRKKVGVAGQNAERAGFVFGAQVRYTVSLDDNGKRRRYGQFHGVPAFARVSLCRASSRSPTM